MANNLIISYDLYRPGQNYTRIAKAIRSLGAAVKIQKSVWYVSSSHNQTVARDALVRAIDRNDSVVVVNATTDAIAWHGLDAKTAETVRRRWQSQSPTNYRRFYGT